jgi:hypothetical protein
MRMCVNKSRHHTLSTKINISFGDDRVMCDVPMVFNGRYQATLGAYSYRCALARL